MEYVIAFFLTLVIGGIGMWIRKRYLKKVMERGSGKKSRRSGANLNQ